MAENVTIGGSGALFVGEDKTVKFELFLKSDSAVAVDMNGWAMIFDVRAKDNSAAPALLSITSIPLTGVFNAVRAMNTQRAVLTLTDDHMNLFRQKTYRWSWKRTDAGNETVLAWGDFTPQKATAP